MTIAFLDQKKGERLQTIMNTDAEFKLAARFMSEDVLFAADDSQCIVRIQDGVVTEIKYEPSSGDHWSFSIQATADSWDKLLQLSPPPFYTGLNAGMLRGNLEIMGDIEVAFAYFWAMNRMLDLMRQLQNE